MTKSITIPRPDDWHLHLRDGEMLAAVAPYSAAHFHRAIIMPNLVPPVVTTADATAYKSRIEAAAGPGFAPLMTLYLTENTDPNDVTAGAEQGLIHAVKLYPAGATTNSDSGVKNFDNVMGVLERMAEIGLPMCVHGEVTHNHVDIFDREKVFIETVLDPLRKRLPELRVTMEHITTADAAQYVAQDTSGKLAASITTHHLILNRNNMLVGGIRPHYYCLPILKREEHRKALVAAAIGGDPRYFLGTDSAPHPTGAKESACGCAGVFSAMNTMSCLAHVFETENALDKLAGFASQHGPAWYGLPVNTNTMTLEKREDALELPIAITTGEEAVTVFDPGFPLYWHVKD